MVDPSTASTRTLLTEVTRRLEPHLPRIVSEVHARLDAEPAFAAALQRLTPAQRSALRARTVDHLRLLLSPDLDRQRLEQRSRRFGRDHAVIGLEADAYAVAVADHRRGVLHAVTVHAADLDPVVLHAVLNERFIADLHGMLLGYREVDDARNRLLVQVSREVTGAQTVADLARGLVDALGSLDGMAACFFARPDVEGHLQYETGAGPGFPRFVAWTSQQPHAPISTAGADPTGQGPTGRAWREGAIRICQSWLTDPDMEPWRDMAVEVGWRSSAAVPLLDASGRARAMLSLQAAHPGYFGSTGMRAVLEQVQQIAELALVRIEDRPVLGSAVAGMPERSSLLALLERGDVEMHYQPVVRLADGALRRLEALARLRDGDRLVAPAEFLPAFGEEELFTLFRLGLQQSLAALAEWERQGLHTAVSLNLPVVATTESRYVDTVAELLATYDIAPQRLTVELLETGWVEETLRHAHTLQTLIRLGVRVAQDDLGSGYSSLLRLRHFPFDEVKIDKSLVQGTDLVPGAALHFIEPIGDIARSLGMSVVIEGLEDEGLIEAARRLGVHDGQGFGIARPMPGADVPGWARGFRLDADLGPPRTATGALAAHVAWERLAGLDSAGAATPDRLGLPDCPLSAYLHGAPRRVRDSHRTVHAAAVAQRGSRQHRDAWAELSRLVGGG